VRHALAPAYRAVLALLLLAGPSLAAQAIAPLSVRAVEYKSDDIEVPAVLAGPRSGGPYPGVIFVHGRSGWHDRLRAEALREPDQVYRYMPEVEQWRVPALLMVGEKDHQLRRELVVRVAERLQQRGISVELVVYPGAQRAFDFRRNDRTLGDDLARADALERTVRFLNRVLRSGP